MARVVLGMAAPHSGMLGKPPATWLEDGEHDRRNNELWYRNRSYTFEQLKEERKHGANSNPVGLSSGLNDSAEGGMYKPKPSDFHTTTLPAPYSPALPTSRSTGFAMALICYSFPNSQAPRPTATIIP